MSTKKTTKKKAEKKTDPMFDDVIACVKDIKENGGKTKDLKIKTLNLLEQVCEDLYKR